MSSDVQSFSDPGAPGDSPRVSSRRSARRVLRWVLPVAVVAAAGLTATGMIRANANPNLPGKTPLELLAAVGQAQHTGFSGTVVEKASLGLPELGAITGSDSSTGLDLLSGSHTVRVWYGGPTQQRVAVVDSLGESDVFRNGATVWEWNSAERTAVRHTLPDDVTGRLPVTSMAPSQAAQQLLSLISPTTDISTDKNVQVAGRSAYELVLTPKETASRIGRVRIAVDGKTMVPLAFQVYARDAGRPALDISFTRFDDAQPTADNFTWQPPAGVRVTQGGAVTTPKLPLLSGKTATSTVGTGWTTVLKVSGLPSRAAVAKQDPRLGLVYELLPAVKGSWGSGHLYQSALFCVLITDDGRVYAGAVDPSVLYAAAAQK